MNSIPAADMIAAFRYVFGAAAALMAGASLSMMLMEERTLAGPADRWRWRSRGADFCGAPPPLWLSTSRDLI